MAKIVNTTTSIVQATLTMTQTICFLSCFFLNKQKNLVSYKNKKRMSVYRLYNEIRNTRFRYFKFFMYTNISNTVLY